jgi:hypothetical protein
VIAGAARALDEGRAPTFDNFVGRKMHGAFLRAGFRNVSTRSYAIQKVGPLTPESERYIRGNATWYGGLAAPYLSDDERRLWAEYFDPDSERYLLARDDFYFCVLETVTVGTV